MSQQVKIPAEVKREVELCSAITGKTQGELLATAWHEYRKANQAEFAEGLRWAQSVLADPARAAVAASGMSADDLAEIREAFDATGAEQTARA